MLFQVRSRGASMAALAIAAIVASCGVEEPASAALMPSFELLEDLRYAEGATTPLSYVRDITSTPDGEIFVIDARTSRVLRYDAEGSLHGLIGTKGEGPGEFADVSRIGFVGDTLWVIDHRLNRVSYFDLTGGLLGTTSAGRDGAIDGNAGAALLAPYPDLSLLYGALRSDSTLTLYRANSDSVIILAELDSSERYWRVPEVGTSLAQPLALYSLYSADRASSHLVIVHRSTEGPDSASYRVEWIAPDGDMSHGASVAYTPHPITESDIERALATFPQDLATLVVQTGQFATRAAFDRAARSSLVVPATLPPIPNDRGRADDAGVLPTPSNDVWIKRWPEETEPALLIWDIVSPQGLQARVRVPADIRLLEVRGDYAWGVRTSDLGVPTIIRFRIAKSDG